MTDPTGNALLARIKELEEEVTKWKKLYEDLKEDCDDAALERKFYDR